MSKSAAAQFTISRIQAERLLFDGESALRFTQDTPVMPDVWLYFAQSPRERLSLLITPLNDAVRGGRPGALSREIQARITADRERTDWGCGFRRRNSAELVYNRLAVNAHLWFDEVVRVLLPMSYWWQTRLASQAQDWPLWYLNDPDKQVRTKCRGWVIEALKRSDPHVRTDSLSRAQTAARLRAKSAFTPLTQPEPAANAGDSVSQHEARQRAYREQFKRVAEAGRELAANEKDWPALLSSQGDILWMIRVVGTLGALFQQQEWMLKSPLLSQTEAQGPALIKELDLYYRRVVDTAADMFVGLEGLTAASDRVHKAIAKEGRGNDNDPPAMLHSISTCRKAAAAVSRSRSTVNADAAVQLFEIDCRDITWAVVDSGIDATHPAFLSRDTGTSRIVATFDFTFFRELLRDGGRQGAAPSSANLTPKELKRKLELKELFDRMDARTKTDLRRALQSGRELDWPMLMKFIRIPHTAEAYTPPLHEHGTHVAGILGADCPDGSEDLHRGLCPEIRIYDFRVLGDDGQGDEFNVMAALQLIRYLNAHRDVPAIHGVNLSFSIPHDVANFACGRTPICAEAERLVHSGVVVVAAAGNEGYVEYLTGKGPRDNYRSISITDPGNARAVITVGATHRFEPHNYGVSYFSSRGPTGDGRHKPDLVAPGEKIHSTVPGGGYKPMDGTSMAAPHVSGAAALLLARHRELIGQPARVKQILCSSATDLGRERYFQGAGMLDVLRAMQTV